MGPPGGCVGRTRERLTPARRSSDERSFAMDESERGKPASFDRRTGAVHGSGSGAGGGGNPDEDYDQDPESGSGKEDFGRPRRAAESVDRPIDPDEGT